jgi:hypothetical protein
MDPVSSSRNATNVDRPGFCFECFDAALARGLETDCLDLCASLLDWLFDVAFLFIADSLLLLVCVHCTNFPTTISSHLLHGAASAPATAATRITVPSQIQKLLKIN